MPRIAYRRYGAGRGVLSPVQVQHAGSRERGHRVLALAVRAEQHRVVHAAGRQCGDRARVQPAEPVLRHYRPEARDHAGVRVGEHLHFHLDRVQRLAHEHVRHAPGDPGQRVGQQMVDHG